MSNKHPEEGNTRIASYMLLERDGKIALVLRSATGYRDGEWSLPAGKVDENETFTEAAVRELNEEAGVVAKPADIKHIITMHRKSDNEPNTSWVDIFFECKKWEGEPFNAEPHKHSELEWFALDNLPETFMDYQRIPIEAWMRNNRPYVEFGWKD